MPVGGVSGVGNPFGANLAALAQSTPTTQTAGTGGAGFGAAMSSAVDGLSALQKNADGLALKAVTGDLTDIHQATIAATRAQVTMELVSAVRNKGVEAFNEIMRMQA